MKQKLQHSVAYWLFGVAALVFLMVIVGAITRLSESGLSMVEWRPLIGALPPLSEAEWTRVFTLYQQSPEYQKVHFWMGLEDFKRIFFWEWFHRFLGRLIGLAYGLPFLYFLLKKSFLPGDTLKLTGLLCLGAFQGVLGWYMVKSGLVDEPSVSHYRLAAHLGTAFLIFALLLWMGLKYIGFQRRSDNGLYIMGWAVTALLIVTIFWGAYVAGLDAGMIYNEFPTMGEGLVPPDMWFYDPVWINLFENAPAVQFTHRWLALSAALFILFFASKVMIDGRDQHILFPALGGAVCLQVILGITTLLTQVHLHVAVMHQAGALILLGLMVAALYRLKPDRS